MHVFVYGTLLPGESRWPLIAEHVLDVERAAAPGDLYDTGRGYPAAVFAPAAGAGRSAGRVPGARLTVLDDLLPLLDGIEGEGTLYRRVEVATDQGPAWSYEWLGPVDGLAPLPAGWPAPWLHLD